MSELPVVLKPREIATAERVDIASVLRWCRLGHLRAYRVGGSWRIPRDAYLDFRRHNSPPVKAAPPPTKAKRVGKSREAAADRILDAAGV